MGGHPPTLRQGTTVGLDSHAIGARARARAALRHERRSREREAAPRQATPAARHGEGELLGLEPEGCPPAGAAARHPWVRSPRGRGQVRLPPDALVTYVCDASLSAIQGKIGTHPV
jgi:hypothetical protein